MIAAILVFYPFSIGPVSWLGAHRLFPLGIFRTIYKPLAGTGPIAVMIDKYQSLWISNELSPWEF